MTAGFTRQTTEKKIITNTFSKNNASTDLFLAPMIAKPTKCMSHQSAGPKHEVARAQNISRLALRQPPYTNRPRAIVWW